MNRNKVRDNHIVNKKAKKPIMKTGKSLGIGLFESGHDVELYPPKNAKPADTITITIGPSPSHTSKLHRTTSTSASVNEKDDDNNSNGYAFYYDEDADDDISAISMSSRFMRRVHSVNSFGINDDNFPKICGRLIKIGSKIQIEGMIERSDTNDKDGDDFVSGRSSSRRRLETMDSIFSEQL